MKNLRSLGVTLSCIVLFFQLLVTTSSHWYYITYVFNFNIGLWRICGINMGEYPFCFNSVWYPEIMDVIRAFLVLAVVFSCLAVFSGVSSFFCKKVPTFLLSSAVCSFLSGVFAIIGMAVFTYHIPKVIKDMLPESMYGEDAQHFINRMSQRQYETQYGPRRPSFVMGSHSYYWAFYISWLTVPALCIAGAFNLIAFITEKKKKDDGSVPKI